MSLHIVPSQQNIRFLAERAARAENMKQRGLVGYCRECGKTGAGWTLFCRRKRCKACRAAASSRFEAKIFAHVPFWPEWA